MYLEQKITKYSQDNKNGEVMEKMVFDQGTFQTKDSFFVKLDGHGLFCLCYTH